MITRKHILLVGNAPSLPATLLRRLAAGASLIVATDGGADKALAAGLRPQVVIGDLDTVSEQARTALAQAQWVHVKKQDNTDLEKALLWLKNKPSSLLLLAGFSGGRIDFEIGNFLAVYPYLKKHTICFIGPHWQMWPLRTGKNFTCRKGARLSLIPLQPCRGVSLSGCQYTLHEENLSWKKAGYTLSNRVQKSRVTVSLRGGYLLVYIEE